MIKYIQLLLLFLGAICTNQLQAQNDTTDDSWRNENNLTITDSTTIITNRLGIGSNTMNVANGLHLFDKSLFIQEPGGHQWRIYSGNSNEFWIRNETANRNVFEITSIGNIGIGTGSGITPQSRLHLRSYDQRALLIDGGEAQGNIPIFQIRADDNEPLISMLATRKMGIGTTQPTASLQISSSDSLNFQDYSGLKIRGNFNTSSAQIINTYEGNAAGGLTIETTDGTGQADALKVVTHRSSSPNTMLRIPNYSAQTNFILLAEDGGNVGIGTTTPEKALDVCGHIRAKEVVIESGWCDYVFHKNYQLPTLTEQANFIEKNGHLKNFDSEKEMDGEIQVADVTQKQQQTLEEMMLYLIQMEKKMDNFQKENQQLQARVLELEKQLDNKK